MILQNTIILLPSTNAGTSSTFGLSNDGTNVSIVCSGLQGIESAYLEYFDIITNAWLPYLVDGINPAFSVMNNQIVIENQFNLYRIVKSATANAVGVYTSQWLP